MRHIFRSRVQGTVRTEAGDGARRNGECVFTIGFYPGLGQIDRQARIRAAVERRTAAAAGRSGPHLRLPDNICVGAVVQVLEQRRQIMRDARQTSRRWPTNSPSRSTTLARDKSRSTARRPRLCSMHCRHGRLHRAIDPRRRRRWHDRRQHLRSDPQISAARSLTSSGPSQPLTTFGAAAGTLEITLPDGAAALATVRALRNPLGMVAVIQTQTTRFQLALHHRAHRHAVGDNRFCRADPRLRFPLAGDARARSRSHPRHRSLPHRHRTQPWPLWTMGLGPCARPRVLVALDVRHSRPAGADDLLTFGELNALVHGGDIDLYGLATAARGRRNSVDRSCLPHAPRRRPLAVAAGRAAN